MRRGAETGPAREQGERRETNPHGTELGREDEQAREKGCESVAAASGEMALRDSEPLLHHSWSCLIERRAVSHRARQQIELGQGLLQKVPGVCLSSAGPAFNACLTRQVQCLSPAQRREMAGMWRECPVSTTARRSPWSCQWKPQSGQHYPDPKEGGKSWSGIKTPGEPASKNTATR